MVAKTQAKAIPRFLSSSLVITSSVSQLLYSFGKSGSEAKKRKSIEEKTGKSGENISQMNFQPTRVRGKTFPFPEKLLLPIMDLTLVSAG